MSLAADCANIAIFRRFEGNAHGLFTGGLSDNSIIDKGWSLHWYCFSVDPPWSDWGRPVRDLCWVTLLYGSASPPSEGGRLLYQKTSTQTFQLAQEVPL